MLTNLFIARSRRSFHTADSPDRARAIVARMTVNDGAPGGLPPGVVAVRTGDGHFNALSPVAGFDSTFEVRGHGHGGSIVTDVKLAASPLPGMAWVADAIHDVATSPRDAYFRARAR